MTYTTLESIKGGATMLGGGIYPHIFETFGTRKFDMPACVQRLIEQLTATNLDSRGW